MDPDQTQRASGILLHVTSLPGPYGIGDMGQAAYDFVDFLERTRQRRWQVLPLGPTGYGDSPYQCFSAFAGNPLLVSLEQLVEQRLLEVADLPASRELADHKVQYGPVNDYHWRALERAYERFESQSGGALADEYTQFCADNAWWLDDFALFMALKNHHGGQQWTRWSPELAHRRAEPLQKWAKQHAREIERQKFVQHQFYRQWTALKRYANERGILIVGDIPIFVAHDSSDVWTQRELFTLAADGEPAFKAGVPPDLFSADGQMWGNPLYRWDVAARSNYRWWVQRFQGAQQLFDIIRLDHFRGFEAYWEIPGDAESARFGRWAPGPGAEFFRAVEAQIGRLPLIAEDLGVITAEVDALRDELGYPGMRVLQFAFGDDPKAKAYQPHHYIRNCVVYTGTHDNDTVLGWFHSKPFEGTTQSAEVFAAERRRVLEYVASDGREIHWDLIRLAWASVAGTAIVPMQDILGLGSEARMNLPARQHNNWQWRMERHRLTPAIEQRLLGLTELFDRGVSLDSLNL